MKHDLALARSACVSAQANPVRIQALPWRNFGFARKAALEALVESASQPNPFFESWHLLPSLERLDPHGKVILWWLEDAKGGALGLIPLQRQSSYYGRPVPHWRNWMHANCFLGTPLVQAGYERAFWDALLGWLDAEGGLPMFFHLAGLPLDTALSLSLEDSIAERQRRGGVVHLERRAMLASALDAESYLAQSLSTKRHKELRRQRRRLEELGKVEDIFRSDPAGIDGWVDDFLAIEAAGWKGEHGNAMSRDPAQAAIFREALHGAAARGKLERRALLLDGQPIAMLATFRTPPGAFSYKTAYIEDHARFSPGVQLQLANLDTLGDNEIAWVDSCACEDHPMIDKLWQERRPIARYSVGIGGAVRQALFGALLAMESRAE